MVTYQGPWAANDEGSANNMNAGYVQMDTFANRPAAGREGVEFFASDTGAWYRDNGTTWDLLRTHGVEVIKSADETLDTSTTLQNDDDLLQAMGADEKWLFKLTLIYSCSNPADMKIAASIPSGAAASMTMVAEDSAGTIRQVMVDATTAQALESSGSVIVVQTIYFHCDTAGTAGNFQIQWAQNTSDASTNTVHKGSMLEGWLIE